MKVEIPAAAKVNEADASRLVELGRILVNQLYVTYKTAQVYEQNNLAFLKQSQNLARGVERILDSYQALYLQLKNGYLFLNDVRLKFDFAGYIGNKFLIEEMQRTRIGGIFIQPGVTQRELDKFIYLLVHLEAEPEELFEAIRTRLADIGAIHLVLEELPPEEYKPAPEQEQDNRQIAKKTFFKAISVVKEVMSNAREQKLVNLARAKRVVQTLVDQILKDEKLFLELSTIKNFDEYTFVHSANVAVLCIILGLRLGLDKQELSELGFAALFHDIGKVKLPIDLINKPGEFDEFDWEQMRKHPVMGVKTMISARNLDDFTTRAVVVCFEHHLTLDSMGGYPKVKERRILNLHTRILQIADAYNAMTSGRVYIKTAVPPYEVLRKMWRLAGKGFDANIMKLFTNIMGIYPAGSLVLLDTEEVAVVYQNNADNIYRPKIKIIADRGGKKHDPVVYDLSEATGGTFSKNIVRVLDAEKYGIDVAGYIVDY